MLGNYPLDAGIYTSMLFVHAVSNLLEFSNSYTDARLDC
jgi:hypothetical protein